jgi:hypothetical protein
LPKVLLSKVRGQSEVALSKSHLVLVLGVTLGELFLVVVLGPTLGELYRYHPLLLVQ